MTTRLAMADPCNVLAHLGLDDSADDDGLVVDAAPAPLASGGHLVVAWPVDGDLGALRRVVAQTAPLFACDGPSVAPPTLVLLATERDLLAEGDSLARAVESAVDEMSVDDGAERAFGRAVARVMVVHPGAAEPPEGSALARLVALGACVDATTIACADRSVRVCASGAGVGDAEPTDRRIVGCAPSESRSFASLGDDRSGVRDLRLPDSGPPLTDAPT